MIVSKKRNEAWLGHIDKHRESLEAAYSGLEALSRHGCAHFFLNEFGRRPCQLVRPETKCQWIFEDAWCTWHGVYAT